MSNESTNPQLSFYSRADWLAGYLRVDRVRLDTLVQLVAGWADEDTRDDVIALLDELSSVVQSANPPEGTVDAAVEAVEGAAGMDLAQIPIDQTTAFRLNAEVAGVADKLCRFGAAQKPRIPRQQDRRVV